MKKLFAAIAILGLGIVLGCGDDTTKQKTTTGTTAAGPGGTVTHNTSVSTDTKPKDTK